MENSSIVSEKAADERLGTKLGRKELLADLLYHGVVAVLHGLIWRKALPLVVLLGRRCMRLV